MKQITLGGLLYAEDNREFFSPVEKTMFYNNTFGLYPYIHGGQKINNSKPNFKVFECGSFDRKRVAHKAGNYNIVAYFTYFATIVASSTTNMQNANSKPQLPGGWAICRTTEAPGYTGCHKIGRTYPKTVLLMEMMPLFAGAGCAGKYALTSNGAYHLPGYANKYLNSTDTNASYAVDWIRHKRMANFGMPAPYPQDKIDSASPMAFINRDNPPILLTHAIYDTVVPIDCATAFEDAARDHGGRIESYYYNRRNEGHCVWIKGSDPHKLHPDIEERIKQFASSLALI